MRRNRGLVFLFVGTFVLQAALPIIAQKMTHAIIIRQMLHWSILLCILAGVAVAVCQALRPHFSTTALVAYYIGLALLILLDIGIENLINSSV